MEMMHFQPSWFQLKTVLQFFEEGFRFRKVEVLKTFELSLIVT